MRATQPFTSSAAPAAARYESRPREVASRRVFERLMRFGYVIRGILYIMPGVLAFGFSLGRRESEMTPTAAIDTIGRQPFGRELLIAVAVGLASYALWGVIRALFDPLGRGNTPHGLAQRFGYATSAITYAGLSLATLHSLEGPRSTVASSRNWIAQLLAMPFGAWLLGAFGVGWIAGAGIAQIVSGWSGSFQKDLALERMSAIERQWAILLGRIGIVARGLVFSIIGVGIVSSAVRASSRESATMDTALSELAHQPFGRAFLLAAAIGIIVFGIFSVMCARWMRVQPGHRSDRTASSSLLT